MEITYHGKAAFTIKEGKNTISADVNSIKIGDANFDWPGEYEAGGIHVRGMHSKASDNTENIIFTVHLNGINVCHLGAINEKVTEDQTEKIGDVDVLFIPVGGKDKTLDAKGAKAVIEEIEPRVIIPMLYNGDKEQIENFLTIMGAQNTERVDTLSLKKSDLPESSTKVIVLNAR